MSHFRLVAATVMAISVIALPAFALALSSTDSLTGLQQQLQSLLAEIAQLQQASSSTPAVTPVASASDAASSDIICPTIVRTLALDSSGTDVANLQGFLAQNPLIYPEQSVTGYFNMYTQDAVQRWQTAYGVVSSGSPETTGYGVVGPHTRAAILASCASGQSSSDPNSQPLCAVAPEPSTVCPGTWSPLTNETGCTIGWQCSVPLSSLVGSSSAASSGPTLLATTGQNSPYIVLFTGSKFPTGMYTVDFGDGVNRTQTVTAICSTTPGNLSTSCGAFSVSHVYLMGGTYEASIIDSTGTTVATTDVYIDAPSVTYTYPEYTYPYSPVTFTVSPSSFTALPDQITFNAADLPSAVSNYTIDFGDGSSNGSAWSSTASSNSYTQMHSYATYGTFTANLIDSTGTTLATITITISQTSSNVPTITSITPASGANGTLMTIHGAGFLTTSSSCSSGETGCSATGGNTINLDGKVFETHQNSSSGGTAITFTAGKISSSNGTAPVNHALTIGTHQISVTNVAGTSNTATFKITR